jgi:hypothetical protein
LRLIRLPGRISSQFKAQFNATSAAQRDRVPGIQRLWRPRAELDTIDRCAVGAANIDHLPAPAAQRLNFRVLARNLAIGQHQAIGSAAPNRQRFGSQIDQTRWSANGCTHTHPSFISIILQARRA